MQGRWISHVISGKDNNLRDISQSHEFSFFNPKLGLSHEFNKHLRSFLFAGIAHREPNRSNFTDARPGAAPGPETLYNIEAAASYRSERLMLHLGPYLMWYKDQLVMTGEINDVGAPVMVNIEKSYRVGIELEAGIEIIPALRWEFNATLSRNRIPMFESKIDDWDNWGTQVGETLSKRDIAFSPNLIAGSRLIYSPLAGLELNLSSKYVGPQFIDNTSSAERSLDPYLLNNLQANYIWRTPGGNTLGFRLALNNILNTEYESNAWIYRYIYEGKEQRLDGYFPQAGRHLLFAISLAI